MVALCVNTVYSKWLLLFEGIMCPFVIQESLAQRRCVSRSGASIPEAFCIPNRLASFAQGTVCSRVS